MLNITPKAPRKLNFIGFKVSDLELSMLDSMCAQFNCTRSNLLQSLVKEAAAKVCYVTPEGIIREK